MNTKKIFFGILATSVIFVASCTTDSQSDIYESGVERDKIRITNKESVERDKIRISNKESVERDKIRITNKEKK